MKILAVWHIVDIAAVEDPFSKAPFVVRPPPASVQAAAVGAAAGRPPRRGEGVHCEPSSDALSHCIWSFIEREKERSTELTDRMFNLYKYPVSTSLGNLRSLCQTEHSPSRLITHHSSTHILLANHIT